MQINVINILKNVLEGGKMGNIEGESAVKMFIALFYK